jgi:hypothetical protein
LAVCSRNEQISLVKIALFTVPLISTVEPQLAGVVTDAAPQARTNIINRGQV